MGEKVADGAAFSGLCRGGLFCRAASPLTILLPKHESDRHGKSINAGLRSPRSPVPVVQSPAWLSDFSDRCC